jgi:hypothetical protein
VEPSPPRDSFPNALLLSVFFMLTPRFSSPAGTTGFYYYEIRDAGKSTSSYTSITSLDRLQTDEKFVISTVHSIRSQKPFCLKP